MSFENLDANDEMEREEEEAILPEESSNRMFIIAAAVLGAIALLALICIAVYALVLLPRSRSAMEAQRATVDAQNTEIAVKIAQTSTAAAQAAIEAAYTFTPTATSADTPTPVSTSTSVVVLPSQTPLVSPTIQPEMATSTALRLTLTANAGVIAATLTARPQATTIPATGFADEVGLPVLLGLAILFIVIIFLARRLRTT